MNSLRELRRRLRARNAQLPPGTYAISEDMFEQLSQWFEPPGPDEPHEALASELQTTS